MHTPNRKDALFWHLHKIVLQVQNDLISDQTQKQYHMYAVIQIVSYVVPEAFALSAEKKDLSFKNPNYFHG